MFFFIVMASIIARVVILISGTALYSFLRKYTRITLGIMIQVSTGFKPTWRAILLKSFSTGENLDRYFMTLYFMIVIYHYFY